MIKPLIMDISMFVQRRISIVLIVFLCMYDFVLTRRSANSIEKEISLRFSRLHHRRRPFPIVSLVYDIVQ